MKAEHLETSTISTGEGLGTSEKYGEKRGFISRVMFPCLTRKNTLLL